MGDRGRELPHGRDAVRVRDFHLQLAVTPLALSRAGFRPLALGQIQQEGDALVALFVERGRADQYRHAAAVLAEVLLLEGLDGPSHSYLCPGTRGAVTPFRRR